MTASRYCQAAVIEHQSIILVHDDDDDDDWQPL